MKKLTVKVKRAVLLASSTLLTLSIGCSKTYLEKPKIELPPPPPKVAAPVIYPCNATPAVPISGPPPKLTFCIDEDDLLRLATTMINNGIYRDQLLALLKSVADVKEYPNE